MGPLERRSLLAAGLANLSLNHAIQGSALQQQFYCLMVKLAGTNLVI
jgi:hypothetical protein